MTYKKMKMIRTTARIFFGSLACTSILGMTHVMASTPANKIRVIYFGKQSQVDFEKKVKPIFQGESCSTCELVNMTTYTKEGGVDMNAAKQVLESLPENISFIFFDYNMKLNEETEGFVSILNKRTDKGLVVVGAAGSPKVSESSSPLSRTVLGQIKNALIIGELEESDRLIPSAFYGPEMLTAIRPPKDLRGQGYSPLLFVAKLAENWQKRPSNEWANYLIQKKSTNRKLWLDLRDMF